MSCAPADLAACAEREVKKRENAYPRWVAMGRLSQARADQEIAMMRAIAAKLRAEVAPPMPPPQGDLFGGR